GVVFEQDADESLKRTKNSAVQDNWRLLAAILGNVRSVETVLRGHLIVYLDCSALPLARECVHKGELEFGSVEGAIAFGNFVLESRSAAGLGKESFCLIPGCVVACADCRTCCELHNHPVFRESEVGIDSLEQVHKEFYFVNNLFLCAENVGIVLNKAANPHYAVEGAAGLIADAGSEFGHSQREVAVGLEALTEEFYVTGAVHRFNGEFTLFALGNEHVFLVLGPVSRALP